MDTKLNGLKKFRIDYIIRNHLTVAQKEWFMETAPGELKISKRTLYHLRTATIDQGYDLRLWQAVLIKKLLAKCGVDIVLERDLYNYDAQEIRERTGSAAMRPGSSIPN